MEDEEDAKEIQRHRKIVDLLLLVLIRRLSHDRGNKNFELYHFRNQSTLGLLK
jgi:hypothetical protein